MLLLLLPWLMVASRAMEIGDQDMVKTMVQQMREEMREEMRAEIEAVEDKLKIAESKVETLEASSQVVRDIPYLTTCGYQGSWSTPSAIITFDRLVSNFNNANRPGGADGVLDITTGTFTCLFPGHYTVTYSGRAEMDSGEEVDVWLYKNQAHSGYEGQWYSYYSGTGRSYDQGSRTVVSVLSTFPPHYLL